MILMLALACVREDPELRARVEALEARHEADVARIATLEKQLERVDSFLSDTERIRKEMTGEDLSMVMGAVPATIASPSAAPDRCREEGGVYLLPPRDAAVWSELATMARVTKHLGADGLPDGVRISALRSGGLPGSCGFRNGDVVTEAAGVVPAGFGDAARVVEAARAKPGFSVRLVRREQLVKLEFRWSVAG